MKTTLSLTGYQETDTIYSGTRTVVYRAVRLGDQQPVIIKVLRNPTPHFNELVQFRNQYVITRNLDSPYVVHPLSLEHYGPGEALVMPDDGFLSLWEYWQTQNVRTEESAWNRTTRYTEFLHIAIQLADALHYLNQQRIIHKDIKPANILIHPVTQQIQLIDFSIASLLPKEQQQLVNPQVLEGTLAYISPEQTGRMNRRVDYRTDFYSLGVTLYELLTRMLPFSLIDPLALVHCHIAQTPIAPVDLLDAQGQTYSTTLSGIIMKLMAKNAEDRYQSALGLKHDLEQCLQSLENTEEVPEFELGERDVCDRFNIPEKLYGREAAVQTLLDAFERVTKGSSEMLLVAGFSGIGKTVVVNEVHKPIVRQKGYFIKGKFDQFNRNIPFSAFVQAFRELMGQLLSESDADLAHWQTKILEVVGENGQVLIDVIPELEQVIGQQSPATALSGTAAQNRFNLLFQQFIAVFTTPEQPLVIFLDDLQWADSASLNLVKVLMAERKEKHLLLLGAYRDNEVFPAHPLMLTLAELAQQCEPGLVASAHEHTPRESGTMISTMTLSPLSEDHIHQLVAETLSCRVELARPLAELTYRKTQGNPFFTTQFLKGLYDDGLITFERNLGYWQCDLAQVQAATLTDDVVEFMADRLLKLPPATQEVLKLAACIGNQFDLETLAIVGEQTSTAVSAELWRALEDGIILPLGETYKFFQGEVEPEPIEGNTIGYRFLHDRVQQAADALIPSERKPLVRLTIGRRLLRQNRLGENHAQLFAITNHLNAGASEITSAGEREELTHLNLTAGCQAKASAAYAVAATYFQFGLDLLPPSAWHSHYSLALSLHENAAEVTCLAGDFGAASRLITIVHEQARTLLDRIKICEVQILTYMAQGQLSEAVEFGLQICAQLEINLPAVPSSDDISAAIETTFANLAGRDPLQLLDLELMSDPHKQAAIRILKYISPCAYQVAPMLLPLLVMEQVNLSICYGNTALSTSGYAFWGLILCGVIGNIPMGYQFGQLALALLDRLDAQEMRAETLFVINADILHYKEHVATTLPALKTAYFVGLETGNLEFSSLATYIYAYHAYAIGKNLGQLEREIANYNQIWQQLQQQNAFNLNQILQQAIAYLLGQSPQSANHSYTEIYNDLLPTYQDANNATAIYYIYFNQMILDYLLGHSSRAVTQAQAAEQYLHGVTGNLVVPLFYFYDSLCQLATYGSQDNASDSTAILQKVEHNQQKIKTWAEFSPQNYQHKYQLIEAERHRVLDQKIAAIELYDRAIAGAQDNEYLQEEALANELAAKFYLDWGKADFAALHLQNAYYCYARWGAKAKVDHLEANYPELLTSILQHQHVESHPFDSLDTLTRTLTAPLQTQTPSSSSSLSEALDFAAILQAAQKLSGTIELDQLLSDIAEIILTTAGAQKMVLLTHNESQWQLQATAEQVGEGNVSTQTQAELLTAESPVPIRLIQYVKNTQAPVLIHDAKTEITGILAGYLLKHQPQSVLCVPLLNQGDLMAIAYLEHPTTKGVFTANRQTIVEFLCAQAAVALQNAQLYKQAQTALTELQQAQLQLVQSEKMSALGNLVAGVAHEINNPVGFLKGNIQPAQNYVQDLLGLIDILLTKAPNNDPQIQDEVEEIDLEFVREDLPKLLNSMNAGVDRIRNISDSLRTFSRKDQEHKTDFDLHEGIDSTLLILKHRTKANEQRPQIQIRKSYGELPGVQCFPGQLNQVFMNILANAIDVFDEANQEKSYQEIEVSPNIITITTSVVDDQVQIQLQDNGCGMKPETVERIFEQGFTTKAVGKGTGLGMAIAHQIITEKHGGTIVCNSELGQGTTFTITLPTA
ncbi:MAG: AAA family ATPase [Spirulina sp. SIO3F2]|nr:AAA family ATPase [Spirulina sp. SIO3F2]